MLFEIVALLALASTTFARPTGHQHFHDHSGSGGMGYPTGGIWNANSTGGWFLAGGSGALASSTATSAPVLEATVTVIPLPATSQVSAPAAPSAATSPPAAGYALTAEGADDVSAGAESSCSSTTTTTTTEWVTVTVSPSAAGAAAITWPSDGPAAPSTSTSDVANLIVTSSVAAGGFYQHSSSAVVSAPTTLTTTYSTLASSVSSVWSGAASSAAASTASSAAAPSSSGKRGLSYNEASLTDAFSGLGMTWAYNWGSSPGGSLVSSVEYVPMLWGLQFESGWNSAAQSAIASGSTHLLSFNEPDLSTQSNIDPSTAATNHIQYMNPLSSSTVNIGSPAITNGNTTSPPTGINWLSQFFADCGGNCKVDFVAFHWYGSADSYDDFKLQVQDVISIAAANKVSKVWLTEFQPSGTDAEVEAFLAQALPFLDSTTAVERYAYFMCASGAGDLLSGTSLSSIGQAYAA